VSYGLRRLSGQFPRWDLIASSWPCADHVRSTSDKTDILGTGMHVSKVPTAVILTYYQFGAAVRPAQGKVH
jgi:hypothetical protein